MDIVAISSKKLGNKKENKENTRPAQGNKSFIKRHKTIVAPFQLKPETEKQTLKKHVPFKTNTEQVDTTSSKAPSMVNPVQKERKEAVSNNVRIIAEEVAKPTSAMPSKSAPGMYKGKVVQSKIGSIWKASARATVIQNPGNVTKSRSRSVSDLARCGPQKPASSSVITRPPVSSCHPGKTVPATLAKTSSKNTNVAPTKVSGSQTSKINISVTDKVMKAPVCNKLSQYRLTMETTEQRRAKLAKWMASKGKTLKRPAMMTSAPPKSFAKSKVNQKSQSHVQAAKEENCKTKQSSQASDSASTAHCADTQEIQLTADRQTPELLENSVDVLMGGLDDVVVNLCDVLEAMATPSRCNDDLEQEMSEVELKDKKPKEESKESEQVKKEPKESLKQGGGADEVESDNEGVSTPRMEIASVVKYSVKTTPYLQSVKKTIEGERGTSRRRSNIKDLKFLTPVRRSCRIQHKSSHLPSMLVDHDPCVSSLAELVKLDDDPNAYIYRKNPALLEDLPDQR
ncbi:cytoskeleton-associated protein 2 isoform X1 [Betta splendens]|uniref:Cytoskeleton-associated protein 2 isoform X1 n=1 Tax=Betta splendens TaxID=158456 RepID=A0A6P7PJM6_BETSP|nr:cytoskeleton-associated protein 2 isoform X1 [Betta splendens]XP_055370385.1 cytoskeleton-associated protein 2 isoform X1 [Betta splendens]